MAVKVLEVIATIAIIIIGLVTIVVLFVLNRGLRSLNRTLESGRREIDKDIRLSISGLDEARGQLDEISAVTEAARAGMRSALSVADVAVTFLKSRAFQLGVPVALWLLLLGVSIPRSLASGKKKRKKAAPIPPPSWQSAAGR